MSGLARTAAWFWIGAFAYRLAGSGWALIAFGVATLLLAFGALVLALLRVAAVIGAEQERIAAMRAPTDADLADDEHYARWYLAGREEESEPVAVRADPAQARALAHDLAREVRSAIERDHKRRGGQ